MGSGDLIVAKAKNGTFATYGHKRRENHGGS